ncbi:hypothetical protein V7114_09000 [Neobacillus niacini]|uniref:hypothetical protein n=1 Tax=Neobacillus niacini TaxID=86668 RepID=UPI002FFF92B7
MKIISVDEIEILFKKLRPVLDKSNIIIIEDEGLSKILKYYLFLEQCTDEIIVNSSYTFEDILYSQYYWFVTFKNQYFLVLDMTEVWTKRRFFF